jgi:uncharacterized protein (UPF0332 family)
MTDKQAALLSKAERSLNAARRLLEGGDADFASSRAYYTMFYVSEALLDHLGLEFSSHSAVIGAFGKHFAATARLPRQLHRYLLDGFDTRNTGDYDLNEEIRPELAGLQIAHAAEFLAEGVAFLSQQ